MGDIDQKEQAAGQTQLKVGAEAAEGLRQQQAGQQVQRDDQQVEGRRFCAPQTVAEQEDDLGDGAAGKLPGIGK